MYISILSFVAASAVGVSGLSIPTRVSDLALAFATTVPPFHSGDIQLIDVGNVNNFDYTATFTNAGTAVQACVCFKQINANGQPGFFSGNEEFQFTLAANGGTAAIAADPDSAGGCSCGAGSVPLNDFGQFAGTWFEFAFADAFNAGWSGADASSLVATPGNGFQGLNVCGSGTCSTINPDGTGTNAYLPGMETHDGIGINAPPGPLHIDVTVDYAG